MSIEEYFKKRLVEIRDNGEVSQLFSRANKKECELVIQRDKSLFHNDAVQSYYNMVKGTLENYIETGVYSHNDIPELADYLYEYYLALRFAANNIGYGDMQFNYSNEDIDCIISEFLNVTKDIQQFNTRKMMQD